MRRTFLFMVLLVLPLQASASQEWLFSLKRGENVVWQGFGQLSGKSDAQGTLLTATGTGGFVTSDFSFNTLPDSVRIVSSARENTNAQFVWILQDGTSPARIVTLPTGEQQTTVVNLASEPEWRNTVTMFGLRFAPGQEILLTSLTFSKTSPWESIVNGIRSFFDVDEYRSYSINFVWGPYLAFGTAAREQLWEYLPPQAFSATRLVNGILILLFIVYGVSLAAKTSLSFYERHSRFLWWSCMSIVILWVVFDLRMGSEFLSWVARDATTYIMKPTEERTLRDRDTFYDFAEWAKQYVEDRETYVFFAERPWPFLGNMRYITYPAIPGNDTNDDTWVIYKRPEITVDAEDRLSANGSPLSNPGKIIDKFEKGSFVFRTEP